MLRNSRFLFFVGVVVVQLAMVAAMPLRAMKIRSEGTEISLQLAPVDPYDLLTGYSMDLSYRAARLDLYPGKQFEPKLGQTVYVLLEKRGVIYAPLKAFPQMPPKVGPDQVVLKGVYENRGWQAQIWFGAEKLYIPEARRNEASEAVRSMQSRGQMQNNRIEIPSGFARADLKVDSDGNASLLRLRLGGEVYQ